MEIQAGILAAKLIGRSVIRIGHRLGGFKVRGFMKSGHKRTNRLARNHQHYIQSQLDDPPAALLSNTNSGHHASYNSGASDFVPDNSDLLAPAGDLSFVFESEDVAGENEYSSYPYSAQGGDQENDFFAGLSPICNDFVNNASGQENYPMAPLFSAYATNQETDVLTQFVPPTSLPSPTQALPIS
nr:hypothetical protein Iba_chr12aCG11030 [Ipomoea batatas]